ncbi:hypothetical protein BV394_13825 [Brevirhabdus pacifica]|uniref:Uncharacterized protein n=1 Tax=Brevirhabdus pacifica TaxID=1267768 RepID=A0A1U7DLA1_9RHOB|nr:glycosyltransferase family 2 protein [Brevirhabdus pacifica]APX90663.1 hypothetical protein BV394_13825 [Brevirhabdus pacifica]PJJ85190.1 glycosyl transferase family 2 [Brevirhabdus pacifica]
MTRAEPKTAFDDGRTTGAEDGDAREDSVQDDPDGETGEEAGAMPLWFDELSPGGNGEGFFEKGGKHSLMFVRRPVRRLLVSFDNLANVNDSSAERVPWAFKFARDQKISHLGIMAHVADWYRDADLIARMQRLAEEGFFDGYDRVVFAGTSMGAYAAIAFGSLVPGAHVVAFNPQSTLDTELVPWETRYWSGRRQDWSLPLGDAAKLTSGLGKVHIFYDPFFDLDLKHFNRFSGDNIIGYKCWFSNHKSAVFMRRISGLKPVMYKALFEELTPLDFYRIYRARRGLRWYRGGLAKYFDDRGRTQMSERATQAFRVNLRRMEAEAESAGQAADAPEKPKARQAAGKGSKDPKTEKGASPAPALHPAPVRNDKKLILTTMKNEGPFMLEWIAYNRAIGFTDFLIYTNDCTDNTDLIGKRLQELGIARHEDNRFKKGASPQRVALRRGFNHEFTQDADWLICADCDEFLNVRTKGGTLDDLIETTGYADAISLCWKIFGAGGQVDYREGFVTEQFEWAAPEVYFEKYKARGLKTLVRRNDKLLRLSVHRPKFHQDRTDLVWKDAGGQEMPPGYMTQGWSAHKNFSHDNARLHHYAVRSADSFLVKRDRGRTNHIDRDQGLLYWADMNLNQEKDTSIAPHLPKARAEFEMLMSDPELKRLHDGAVAIHRAKIDELKAREGWTDFHSQIVAINPPGEDPVDKTALVGPEDAQGGEAG